MHKWGILSAHDHIRKTLWDLVTDFYPSVTNTQAKYITLHPMLTLKNVELGNSPMDEISYYWKVFFFFFGFTILINTLEPILILSLKCIISINNYNKLYSS